MLDNARTYREKTVKPLLTGIVKVLRSVYHAYLYFVSKLERLQSSYAREISKNNTLSARIEDLSSKNLELRNVVDNYERICRAYGPESVAATVEGVKKQEQAEKEQKRVIKHQRDRATR